MQYKYPLAKPLVGMPEKENLVNCISEGWLSKGDYIDAFEDAMACLCNREHAVSTSSGTTALHLALEAFGIKGYKVIVPTLTYVASVNSILQAGATPVFVDSRESDWQMDVEEVMEKALSENVGAIMAVHLYGAPCDIKRLELFCEDYNIFLIEDAAEALGSEADGRPVGSFGNVSIFSFYGNKNITTGEGGMALTNDNDLAYTMRHLKNHATLKGKKYKHDELGYNYRFSNLQAAVGFAQMGRLEDILAQKQRIFDLYTKTIFLKFNETGSVLRNELKTWRLRGRGAKPGLWLYSLIAKSEELRDGLMAYLCEKGIETRPFFSPVHTMEYIEDGDNAPCFPVAEELSRKGFNLPSYPSLTNEDVKFISSSVLEYLLNNVTR